MQDVGQTRPLILLSKRTPKANLLKALRQHSLCAGSEGPRVCCCSRVRLESPLGARLEAFEHPLELGFTQRRSSITSPTAAGAESRDVTPKQAQESCGGRARRPTYLNAAALRPPLPRFFKGQLPPKQDAGEGFGAWQLGLYCKISFPPAAPQSLRYIISGRKGRADVQ